MGLLKGMSMGINRSNGRWCEPGGEEQVKPFSGQVVVPLSCRSVCRKDSWVGWGEFYLSEGLQAEQLLTLPLLTMVERTHMSWAQGDGSK